MGCQSLRCRASRETLHSTTPTPAYEEGFRKNLWVGTKWLEEEVQSLFSRNEAALLPLGGPAKQGRL